MEKYNFKELEEKWKKKWEEKKIFKVQPEANKKKYYVFVIYIIFIHSK